MQRLKKIVYFLVGLYLVPVIIGILLFWLLGHDDYRYVDFWGCVYFLVYFIFPVLYRGKIREKIPNRYLFYVLLYLLFAALFVWIYL